MLKELINKMKNASFWMSLGGAVVMVLQCLGVKVSAPYVNEVISAVCSVFVIIGIMTPAKTEEKKQSETNCPENQDDKAERQPDINQQETGDAEQHDVNE